MKNVVELFLDYVSFCTTSQEDAQCYPSTLCQLDLLKHLYSQLLQLGLQVQMDQYGYVTATLPTNLSSKAPKLCFIAHVDTSPAVSGKNVNARIEVYNGKDIILRPGCVLSATQYSDLQAYLGQEIIVTDGATLLGADDKAGVAEIVAMVQYLVSNPQVPRPTIKIAFTPDEEVGMGVAHFDVAKFGADFGYTVDGGKIGEINYECFCAASAKVHIVGKSIHPGDAFDKMVNAIDVYAQFHNLLPQNERPCTTKDYQGFYMVDYMHGNVEEVVAKYILRDHNPAILQGRKDTMLALAKTLNEQYGQGTITVEIADSYQNMRQGIEAHMHLIHNAEKAFQQAGITPFIAPIRGGTDGASLTRQGLPCPNISTGGHNFHGRYEYIPVSSLTTMVAVLLNIVALYSDNKEQN